MKKLILYFVLLHSMIILPCEIEDRTRERSPLIAKLNPVTLGNKTFTHNDLSTLSDDDRNNLVRISQPSCISQCYGLSNQLIQPKDVKVLAGIAKKYPKLFTSFEIIAKNRNTGGCSCDPYESLSCAYLDTFGRCEAFSAVGASFLGTIKALESIMTYIASGCLILIPVGCCVTELGNCIHYRCCSGQTKYVIKR